MRKPAPKSRSGKPAVQIALLRGINVGKAKRIAMADLRAIVADLGYRDVRTLLNSGNVVFSAPASIRGDAARRIEAALEERTGVRARVTVIDAEELEAALRAHPLERIATDPSRLLLVVLADPADRSKLLPLAKRDFAPEAFALGLRISFAWCADGILESPLWAEIGRALRDGVTSRNLATMRKLAALAAE